MYIFPTQVQSMHVTVHKYWRKALGLHPWSKLDLYRIPQCGGPGCPKLEVCLPLLFPLMYIFDS